MADRYPHQNSAQALYWPAFGPAFFRGWNSNDTNNHDLLCAEMSRLAYADRPTVGSSLQKIGFVLEHWIGGETKEQRGATHGTDGFVATSANPQLRVLAFRGTESNKPEDILTDALATSEVWDPQNPSRGKVHRGFKQVYALVAEDIRRVLAKPGGQLLITGHSLGAGLATLAAADHAHLKPALVTFGSPLVGDSAFKQTLSGLTLHRFVDCCDLVTRIPPERFDERNIERLLAELIPRSPLPDVMSRGLIKAVAAGLASALSGLNVQPEYEHVCDRAYGDHAGKILTPATPAAIEADQNAARAAYQGGFTPDLKHLLQQLVSAVFAAGVARDPTAIRDAVRNFGARLFQGDPVPLRDLADHAPINYVTLFTGR